jgi:hypothetical protein
MTLSPQSRHLAEDTYSLSFEQGHASNQLNNTIYSSANQLSSCRYGMAKPIDLILGYTKRRQAGQNKEIKVI